MPITQCNVIPALSRAIKSDAIKITKSLVPPPFSLLNIVEKATPMVAPSLPLIFLSISFKADNGLKPGFLTTVEEPPRAELPESGLKEVPHIHSRVRHFRGVHFIIHDMVVESCMSGFGWDSEMKIVVTEKEVWRTYLKLCMAKLCSQFMLFPLLILAISSLV